MQQARYKVNLQHYMAECEANYQRLQQLLPDGCHEVSWAVLLPGDRAGRLEIRVLQRCRYTTMLSLSLDGGPGVSVPQHFELRAYHDARLVEVVAFQSQRRISPRYAYPNRYMYQQDEKWQQHRFLSECLHYCLENGMASELDLPA